MMWIALRTGPFRWVVVAFSGGQVRFKRMWGSHTRAAAVAAEMAAALPVEVGRV